MAISITRRADPFPSARAIGLVVGASAFVLLAVLFALSRSSLFALRHLDVRGAGHRGAAEVRTLADVPEGTNVVWLDTAAVAARLEADRWIARATVTRALPWSLTITVVERTPIAVVDGAGSGTLMAADGTLLGPATDGAELPRIALPPASPATIAMPSEDGALRAIAAMTPAVRHRVLEVDVAVGGTLTLRLRGGATVGLGPAVDLRAKAAALRRMLAWEATTGSSLQSVSLVAPTAPAAVLRP